MPFYKVELSETLNINPGFETGNFSGWVTSVLSPSLISINTTTVFSGSYSVQLEGINSKAGFLVTDTFSIDSKYKYKIKAYTKIASLFQDEFILRFRQYDDVSRGVDSHFVVTNIVRDDSRHDWILHEITLGPSGDNVDYTIMDSADAVRFEYISEAQNSGNLAYIDNAAFMLSVDVTPEIDNTWKLSETQIRNQNRAANGDLFFRKQGEYNNIMVGQRNLAMEGATVINSWYGANKELVLEVTSGTIEPLNVNGDFETGNFSGWLTSVLSPDLISINTTTVLSGDYSAELQGINSKSGFLLTAIFSVDNQSPYIFRGYTKVASLFASSLLLRVRKFDAVNVGVDSGFETINLKTDNSVHDWQLQEFTFGPSGSGKDVTMPDCAEGLLIDYVVQGASSGNLAYIDEFKFISVNSNERLVSATEPYSVMIVNGDTPFQERTLPYDGEFQGQIELEGY
jgi:hypothetical protein